MTDQSVNDGLWLSLTDLAQARGVSKPAISQNLRKWKDRGVTIPTRMEGRTLLINVAAYDAARGEVGNPAYGQEPERDEPGTKPGTDPVFSREQAREKAYSADMKKLQLARELRTTVAIDRLEDEITRVLEPIVKAIDRLPGMAEDVAAAISQNGVQGVRVALKTAATDLRNQVADGLAALASELRAEPRRGLDDFDPTGATEPPPITARQESFLQTGEWKRASISTPTIKGSSRIWSRYEAGDQRRWHVRCPGCSEEFVFEFGPFFRHEAEFPYRAHYVAPCCGTVIEGVQKNSLVRRGRWIATSPGPGKHPSYHFDALSSPFVPWDVIAKRFLDAGDDPSKLKTFYNLTLGLPFEIRGDAPDHVRLMALREEYPRGRIPPLGLLLTAAADVQGNGIYVEVLAHAPNRASWPIEATFLDGDTSDPKGGAFAKLDEFYERAWPDAFGKRRRVDAFGVDSGYRSHVVYSWVRGRPGAFALKGEDGWTRPPLGTPQPVDIDLNGQKIKHGAVVWAVGTWSLKAVFYADLRKQRLAEGAEVEPVGACHFGTWQDTVYFEQITNEYLADEKFKGRLRKVWKPRGPNHFLDCRIYNLALAEYLGLSRMTADDWAVLARDRGVPEEMRTSDLFSPPSVQLVAAPTPSAPRAPEITETEETDDATSGDGWLDGYSINF
ncbi:MAG: putative phage terminase large subunit [Xanthobacteraceae bacterium]|jgi:phage terminase large subunit GpA-like protein/biotin operon repressor|nr:putative phage terminase large subunit [Xanthobacteraceae bacterium]